MKIVEQLDIPEPHWVLDRTGSGPLHWRRHSENNSRVKFRFDVEVKEFHRGDHELEEAEWSKCVQEPNSLVMGLTLSLCIAVTIILPWYILGIH